MSLHPRAALPPSILVVDDSSQNLQIVGATLGGQMDCELSFATSGQMALDSIAERKPDLILLDVVMPQINGIEVCRRLKADPATAAIPVIFLTAKAEPQDVVAGFEAGGADYVAKPFNQAELLARVDTQVRLKRAADEIAESTAELRHLLQILCHDLANPVSSLSGLLDVCASDPDTLVELLPDMRAIARQALDHITLVREMHSVQEGKSHLNLLSFPLADAVQAAEKNVARLFQAKDLRLTCTIPEGLEVRVEPISFINTVLANLLSNAAKFSFRGGDVALVAERADGEGVVLSIRDSGVGIAPARMEGIFLPRANASTAGTEGETGTGFGLPLVKTFVEAYGGRISLESQEAGADAGGIPAAQGTTVTLVLNGG